MYLLLHSPSHFGWCWSGVLQQQQPSIYLWLCRPQMTSLGGNNIQDKWSPSHVWFAGNISTWQTKWHLRLVYLRYIYTVLCILTLRNPPACSAHWTLFRSRRWALKEGHWKKALVKYFRCPKANWKAIVNGGMIWTNDPMINPNSECWAVSYLLELSTSNNPLPGLFLVFHSYLWLLLPCDAISPKNMTNH